ncbi:hypothetical protein XA68_13444 [Ophiocordyceps unilateralis]|uniref:PRISE-like Rossmann-fold domain-containing protein n=1 Tax=Ophiocordyceps unilateralis TaxID=268505 RepID=A0A2A9PCH8_OPHUN|nr:hypothetical protein XA68_13444 [Ophiocordyceps unilateralis]
MADHDDDNHALVFGATGLLGWGVLEQLLAGYPHKGAFSTVTAVVRRTPAGGAAELGLSPAEEFRLAGGVDLLAEEVDLARRLRERVPGVERTTHVFYYVFTALTDDEVREVEINRNMLQRVVDALNVVSPRLRSFVYAGGTKQYGIYAPGGTWSAPLEESMTERLQPETMPSCVYPAHRRVLTEASRGRDWVWTELCPDAVVGFSPFGAAFSLALHWAQYLSLYAAKEGAGAIVSFPGRVAAYEAKFTPVSSRILGRASIYTGLRHLLPDHGGVDGKVINVADSATPVCFRQLWPEVAAWFGLVGVAPDDEATRPKPGAYLDQHGALFAARGKPRALARGVGAGRDRLDSVGWWLTFDRFMTLGRLRDMGFVEERGLVDGWYETFERLREADIIL